MRLRWVRSARAKRPSGFLSLRQSVWSVVKPVLFPPRRRRRKRTCRRPHSAAIHKYSRPSRLRNVCEWALHPLRKPLEEKKTLMHVQHKNHGHIHSTFPGYTNVVNNIPRLAPGDSVRVQTLASTPRGAADAADDGPPCHAVSGPGSLRAEQKNVKLLREVTSVFTVGGTSSWTSSLEPSLRHPQLSPSRNTAY